MDDVMLTKWGRAIDPEHVLEEYPRPGMRRGSYVCLNGVWDYAITQSAEFPDCFDGTILVPFSPEAALSGVNRVLRPNMFLHYQRQFVVEKLEPGKRLILHFGAVDQRCEVFVNGHSLGTHLGGYWHFSFDITEQVREGENTLRLTVQDPTGESYYARGKQSLERGGMWYTPQSGIWQTVWMEYVPEQYIESVCLTPNLDDQCIEVQVAMHSAERLPLVLTVSREGQEILQAKGMTEDTCRVKLPTCQPWTPENPVLYDIRIQVGEDEVSSYFAMRKISMERDSKGIYRLFLNNKPYFHNGILDQGYYPDGLYTPPADEAMVNDILQMKALGFNMMRKHAKIEPDRWYYHCDRLGMLVWQDMVNGGKRYRGALHKVLSKRSLESLGRSRDENLRVFLRLNHESRDAFASEVSNTIQQLHNFPSIVVWTVFNEAWGEFLDATITKRIWKTDPSRLVDEASGWVDQGGGDINSSHNYFLPLKVKPDPNRCVALSEFGGYSWHMPDRSWAKGEFGYRKYHSSEELTSAIEALWQRDLLPNVANGLSAIAYTEVCDVEDETNGLFTYDREVLKVDGETIRRLSQELLEAFEDAI